MWVYTMWEKLKEKIKRYSTELSTFSILTSSDLSKILSATDWFKSLNNYTSEVSKAMDKEFLLSLKGQATEKMAPTYHRIVDGGHDFFSSIEKAREIGEQKSWTEAEIFTEWAKSYFTDLSSPAGMPILGKMSEQIYKFMKEVGISEEIARDIVTINGQEAIDSILSGSITFLAIFLSWKKEDKEAFSKTIGSILLSSTVMLNPVTLAVGLIGFAIGYQKLVNAEAIARGSIITGSGFAISALIPGPVILGMIPALIVSIYISKKMGDDFNPIKHSKEIVKFITSKDFRSLCDELYYSFSKKENKGHAA